MLKINKIKKQKLRFEIINTYQFYYSKVEEVHF